MPQLPEKWINRIFERLNENFEGAWSVYVGNKELELKHEWAIELAWLTADDIKRGLEASYTHDDPPTLEQFKRLCNLTQSAFREHEPVDYPKADDATRVNHMKSIGELLGIKK